MDFSEFSQKVTLFIIQYFVSIILQVTNAKGEVWGQGVVFAVGDCNYGCVGSPQKWELHPIPKISYPSEEQAYQACGAIEILDAEKYLLEIGLD